MRYVVVTIRDAAATVFSAPNFAVSVGSAVRSFGDLVGDPNSPIGKHPADYELYEVGEFNDADGLFDIHVPRLISRAVDFSNPYSGSLPDGSQKPGLGVLHQKPSNGMDSSSNPSPVARQAG